MKSNVRRLIFISILIVLIGGITACSKQSDGQQAETSTERSDLNTEYKTAKDTMMDLVDGTTNARSIQYTLDETSQIEGVGNNRAIKKQYKDGEMSIELNSSNSMISISFTFDMDDKEVEKTIEAIKKYGTIAEPRENYGTVFYDVYLNNGIHCTLVVFNNGSSKQLGFTYPLLNTK